MSKAPPPLTQVKINSLRARGERYEVADPGHSGLKLVVFPSGVKSFVVRYRFGGRKRKLTLGGIGLAAARKAAAAALYEVHEGRDPAEAKKQSKQSAADAAANTVKAVCEDYYLRGEGRKLRTVEAIRRDLTRLVYPALGREPMRTLRRSQLVALLKKIALKNGSRMADTVLAAVRTAFNAYEIDDDDFRSPIRKGMNRHDYKPRERWLDDDEIRAIWAATEQPRPFHGLLRFLLLTGARLGEAAEMPWSEVVGGDWKLPADAPIGRNKVGLELVRPLGKAARAVLAALPRIGDSQLVFTNDGVHPISVSKPMKYFRATCGVTDHWTIHDLRRTAQTLMSRAGVSSDHADKCLGHVLPGMRKVYDQHTYYEERKRAYEALEALISRIINPPAGNVTQLKSHKKQLASAG